MGRHVHPVRIAVIVMAALTVAGSTFAQTAGAVDRGARARTLSGGWGVAWPYGIPGWGKTSSDVQFISFHPGLGWFVLNRAELFGEATLFVYYRQTADITAGLAGIGGRYHFRDRGRVLPFVSGGAGLVWTSLDVPEIDRLFNGQLFYGAGVRLRRSRNPGWIVEVRNHHISNAGTKGANLGLNALMVIVGVEWLLPSRR